MREGVNNFVEGVWQSLNIHSVVDLNYAIGFYKKEIITLEQHFADYFNGSNVAKYLYHNYLMGVDLGEFLQKREFYDKFFYGDLNFFQPLDNKDNLAVVDDFATKPVFFEFVLSSDIYEEIYKQVFDYICQKEVIRIFTERLGNISCTHLSLIDTTTKSQYSTEEKNCFNQVPMSLVRKFFFQLVEQNVLNKDEFENFIAKAFGGNNSIERQTLDLTKTRKIYVIKLFHLFYQKSISDFALEKRKNCISSYKSLLTDNFTNWEHDIEIKNFSRVVSKHPWEDWNSVIKR